MKESIAQISNTTYSTDKMPTKSKLPQYKGTSIAYAAIIYPLAWANQKIYVQCKELTVLVVDGLGGSAILDMAIVAGRGL